MLYGNCAYCGVEAHLTRDHVVPVSRGGSEWPTNIKQVCAACNNAKKSRTLEDFRGSRRMNQLRKAGTLADRRFWFEIPGNTETGVVEATSNL